MDEGYYYEDEDDEMDYDYYQGVSQSEITFIFIQCRTQINVVLFVMNLDLLLYERSVRNVKRAEQLRNKAQVLLRMDQRERRY